MELISLTQKNLQSIVESAAEAIRRGGVLVVPTDTVYGMVANALDEKAVEKVYLIKRRAAAKPLPIFVKNITMAKKYATISARQEKFLEEKWPGKVTAILKKKPKAKIFGTNGNTIALRIPFNHFINSLLETLNIPLCGTSANISGQPASTRIDDVIGQFREAPGLPGVIIINAGDLPESKPSTIIDLTQKEPLVIRN